MSVAVAPVPGSRIRILRAIAGTDHKSLGARLFALGFFFFLAGGVLALLMRTELLTPNLQLVSHQHYNELMTMHGSTMFYLFALPITLAVGLYLVPLQIGAADIAWSRLALAGFWLVLAGGLLMWSGFFTDHGAAASGWYAYDPLSDTPNSPGSGMDFWTVGVLVAAAGELVISAALLATVVRQRAPGMTMLRLPTFTWSMVVTLLMCVTAIPPLIVAMALLLAQRLHGGIYTPPNGPMIYQQLFWFFGHPVVYIVFFPFLGAVTEIIATFSGRRWFGYRGLVFALLAFAALSMSVWGHHLFTSGIVSNRFFALTSTALLVPAGIEYFGAAATMWRGSIRLSVAMMFALAFLLMFLIGGLTGIWLASPTLDYNANGTYFVVAHFHYTLFGGSVLGLFAAVYYWFPKVTGRLLSERLGRIQLALTLIGLNVTFLPMFFLGLDGMVRRAADYPATSTLQGLNVLASVGSYVLGLSVLAFLANAALTWRRGAPAGPDPWRGHTLEWATSSPPPRWNFDELPPVRSFAPLLDLREAATAEPPADASVGG